MTNTRKLEHLLILGSTGLVGQQLLALALSDPSIARVTAPTRRPLTPHPKLHNPVFDFNTLPTEAEWWRADAALCALGTTIKQAGSRDAFRSVDFDLIVKAAECTKRAGTEVFVLNSSLGADSRSRNFYLQVKGQTEDALRKIGFSRLVLIRPSLLDGGKRAQRRTGEELGLLLSKPFKRLIPKRYRPVKTRDVAVAMLAAAASLETGVRIIESEQLA
jgi:uncharacterized protein YbjT (DUF2867 family)